MTPYNGIDAYRQPASARAAAKTDNERKYNNEI